MFLRRSRSIDVLGSSKKLDAQQSGGEMKKSKPKLKSMRSFRFLKSPRLGFAPESSSKNPSQTPATRLDGSAISTPLSDAHGLGIKQSTGPGMPGAAGDPRADPHARIDSTHSAMSTDIFSTSRPPAPVCASRRRARMRMWHKIPIWTGSSLPRWPPQLVSRSRLCLSSRR